MSGSYKDAMAAGRAELWAGRERARTPLETVSVDMSEGEAGGNETSLATEEMVAAGAAVIHRSTLIDSPKLTPHAWMGLSRNVIEAALAEQSPPSLVDQEGVREAFSPDGESTALWACRAPGFFGSIKQLLNCARCGEGIKGGPHTPRRYRDVLKPSVHVICDPCFEDLPE